MFIFVLGFPMSLLSAQPEPQHEISPDATTKSATVSLVLSPEEQQYLVEKKQISMCVDPDWMPLEKIENGHHVGMSAEYMERFSSLLGIPIVLVPTRNWVESLAYGKSRRCDIFSLAMPTPERERYMTFTRPYLNIPLVMAAKIETPFIDDVAALTDKKIGIVKGYAFNELLRTRYPQMQIVDVATVHDGLQQVVTGKLFGFVGTLATVGYSIQTDFVGELKVSGKFDQRWQLGIAARNDEPLLGQVFDKAIASIDTATHQKILNNWIAVRYEHGRDYRLFLRLAPFILAVILVLVYRSYALAKYNQRLEGQNREIRHQAEKLRQAEQELLFTQHAVETCVFPIIWVKNSSRFQEISILHANQAASSLLGYTTDELQGRSMAEIDAEITQERWQGEMQSMQEDAFCTLSTTFQRKDGTAFPVELYLNYFEYEHSSYHFAFFMDIGRERDMEERLHRSMKMEAIGLMAGGVAHDLNNILSGMVSYPELLLMKLPQDSELRAPLELIRDSGLRAAEVVSDMLTVTRGVAAAREVVNVNALIREQLHSPEFQQIKADHPDVQCITLLDPDLLNVSCSPLHIRKALMNLFSNAVEAIKDKGTVSVLTKNTYVEKPVAANAFMKPGEYILLSVSDTGTGISPEDQRRIFEPFSDLLISGDFVMIPFRRPAGNLCLEISCSSRSIHGIIF